MRIYLGGGFYGVWKQVVREIATTPRYFDPETDSPQGSIADYVTADLDAIDGSDVLFAYLTDYPTYGGLAAEMGYAYAKGKPIVFVCEKAKPDGFLLGLASKVFLKIADGAEYLEKLATKEII